MKLLFVHDVKSKIYQGKVYARSYGYDIWAERYLSVYDELKICFRSEQTQEDVSEKLDLSSGPNVEFESRIGMFYGPEVFFNKRIKRILRENILQSDAVIVRLDSFLGLQTIKECRKMNRPYLIELVGCAWDSFWNHGIIGKLLAPYLFFRTKKEVYSAPFVVYVTKKFLQSRYPTKGKNTNISNVKLKKLDKQVLIKRIKKIRKYNDKEKKFLTLGTAANVNVKYKGQQFVIEALSILKKKGICKFKYEIIGAGDQSYLRSITERYKVTDLVEFKGSVTHDKVFSWLEDDVDIYIQPSLQEGLPRSVIEAMSFGIPCIGSDVAGIPELLNKECIFRRKGNIAEKIAFLLEKINCKNLEEYAIENYYNSKEYEYNLLLKRRKKILNDFLEYNLKTND